MAGAWIFYFYCITIQNGPLRTPRADGLGADDQQPTGLDYYGKHRTGRVVVLDRSGLFKNEPSRPPDGLAFHWALSEQELHLSIADAYPEQENAAGGGPDGGCIQLGQRLPVWDIFRAF